MEFERNFIITLNAKEADALKYILGEFIAGKTDLELHNTVEGRLSVFLRNIINANDTVNKAIVEV